jgi:RNA polymerase sigma-54 factor
MNVQELDPAGTGARDLRECLLLQVRRMPHSLDQRVAEAILDKHFDAFSKKHYDRSSSAWRSMRTRLKDAIDLIVRLEPQAGQHDARDQQTAPGDHAGLQR